MESAQGGILALRMKVVMAVSVKTGVAFSGIILFALLCVVVSCLNPFAPGLGDVSSSLDIPLTGQTTPEEVLTNFRYAYIYKDSLVYRDVLHDDFVFVWRDHENDKFVSWGKEDDIKTTVGIFNTFSVIHLVWKSTNYLTYSADSAMAEISKGFILTLGSTIRITGDALFYMKKAEDGIWRITRWVDKSIV